MDNQREIRFAKKSREAAVAGIDISDFLPALANMLDDQDFWLRFASIEAIEAAAKNGLDVSSTEPQLMECLYEVDIIYYKAIDVLTETAQSRADFMGLVQRVRNAIKSDRKRKIAIADISREAGVKGINISEVILELVKMWDDRGLGVGTAVFKAIIAIVKSGLVVFSADPLSIKYFPDGEKFYDTAIDILAKAAPSADELVDVIQRIIKSIDLYINKSSLISSAYFNIERASKGEDISNRIPSFARELDIQDDEIRLAVLETVAVAAEKGLDVSPVCQKLIKSFLFRGKFYDLAMYILARIAQNGDMQTQLLLAEEISKYIDDDRWFCAQRKKNSQDYVSVTNDIDEILRISKARLEEALDG